jgi:hypothetical protein
MNETSITARSTGSPRVARGQVPGVRPVVDDDARVAGDPVGELAPPDVDGMDPGRAALEQHVREAAGRSPGVEADEPAGSIANASRAACELVTAPADVRSGSAMSIATSASTRSPAFRSRAGAVAGPDRGPCRRGISAWGPRLASRRDRGPRRAGPDADGCDARWRESPGYRGTAAFAAAHARPILRPVGRAFRRASARASRASRGPARRAPRRPAGGPVGGPPPTRGRRTPRRGCR